MKPRPQKMTDAEIKALGELHDQLGICEKTYDIGHAAVCECGTYWSKIYGTRWTFPQMHIPKKDLEKYEKKYPEVLARIKVRYEII